ncbi:MAG: hypothetical protein IJE05_05305 [Clostridia bacterium]|nr:hypothetical protein [Clostridia bacterium]
MENFENHDIERKDRQLDNLINIVENHTRTERHLEQYSHIGNPENKENARKIQDIREEQINELKDKIKGANDKQTREEQLENVIKKYINAEGYIRNNEDNMSEEQLNNMEKKQDNREIQIQNLEDE